MILGASAPNPAREADREPACGSVVVCAGNVANSSASGPAGDAGESNDVGGERDREGAACPQELVDIKLSTERLVMHWEAVEVFVELGRFAILFAENDLVIDQVEKFGGIDPCRPESLEIGLDRHPLSALPALAVVLDQRERTEPAGRCDFGLGHGGRLGSWG